MISCHCVAICKYNTYPRFFLFVRLYGCIYTIVTFEHGSNMHKVTLTRTRIILFYANTVLLTAINIETRLNLYFYLFDHSLIAWRRHNVFRQLPKCSSAPFSATPTVLKIKILYFVSGIIAKLVKNSTKSYGT